MAAFWQANEPISIVLLPACRIGKIDLVLDAIPIKHGTNGQSGSDRPRPLCPWFLEHKERPLRTQQYDPVASCFLYSGRNT